MYNLRIRELVGTTKSTERNHPECASVLCASLNTADLSPKFRNARPTVSYSNIELRKGMNSPVPRMNSISQLVVVACFFLIADRNIDELGSNPTTSALEVMYRGSAKVTSPVPHARSNMRPARWKLILDIMRLLHVQSSPNVIRCRSPSYSFSTSVKITLTNRAFSANLVGISKKEDSLLRESRTHQANSL
jgi:hypothetical protein